MVGMKGHRMMKTAANIACSLKVVMPLIEDMKKWFRVRKTGNKSVRRYKTPSVLKFASKKPIHIPKSVPESQQLNRVRSIIVKVVAWDLSRQTFRTFCEIPKRKLFFENSKRLLTTILLSLEPTISLLSCSSISISVSVSISLPFFVSTLSSLSCSVITLFRISPILFLRG